jgi:hypothetical protein
MGANEYSVLLKARLDTSGIAKDVQSIQAEINKATMNVGAKQKSPVVEKLKKEFQAAEFKIDPTINREKLQKSLNEITKNMGKLQKIDIISGLDENGIEQMRSATIRYSDSVGKIRSEYLMLDPSIKGTIKSTQNLQKESEKFTSTFGKEMSAVIRRTMESAATLGLMYAALNQIRQGVQYIKDLDKELTNVQVVTGMSEKSVQNLALGYNGLAKEMGVTTLEVARGSLEWYRQGKTAEQASELVKSSMVLSKLGNIEAAQSTEYLTSMMNGFKLEAKDSMGVIDKIISLDNAFATSSAEISSALQRSSVSAQQAGVTFEELASMITVVSDVSRRAPESIGESFKTIFARYQDILAGGVDEEGQGINNVGKALDRVGISIRDVDGGFRDFSDVLEDLYPKWGKLNEIEQAN